VTVPFPIKMIINHNALRWTNQSVGRFLKATRKSFCVRVDQTRVSIEPLPSFRIERAVSLKMVKLTGFEAWNQDTPDISPTINIPVEVDHFGGIAIIYMIIEKNSHPCS